MHSSNILKNRYFFLSHNELGCSYIFETTLFYIVVIAFYVISIWQYNNPTKAIGLWHKSAYAEQPKVDEAYVRRSLIIRGVFFTFLFILILILT